MVRTGVVDEVARNVVVASEPVCASALLLSHKPSILPKQLKRKALPLKLILHDNSLPVSETADTSDREQGPGHSRCSRHVEGDVVRDRGLRGLGQEEERALLLKEGDLMHEIVLDGREARLVAAPPVPLLSFSPCAHALIFDFRAGSRNAVQISDGWERSLAYSSRWRCRR